MVEPKTVGQHFDEWAPRYDAQIREMVPRYEEIHETLLALLALRPPRRFLDLGAGTGYTLRRVFDAFPVAMATGLDVSAEMLERARQRLDGLAGRVELRTSDIAAPEIRGSYDAISSVLAVHHLVADEKRHLFSRIWEHIEPGGIFVIADYFRPAMDRLSELYRLPDEPDPHEVEHDHPDTTAEHLAWRGAPSADYKFVATRKVRSARLEIDTLPMPATEVRSWSSSGSVHGFGSPPAPTRAPTADPTVAPFESVSHPALTASVTERSKSPPPHSRADAMIAALGRA